MCAQPVILQNATKRQLRFGPAPEDGQQKYPGIETGTIWQEGAVWDVCRSEVVAYNGEDTGIKTGISRSYKLALRQTIERDDFKLKGEHTNSSNPSVLLWIYFSKYRF